VLRGGLDKRENMGELGSLGNLIDRTFRLYDAPRSCETPLSGDCVCYKAMIVGKEPDWKKH